MWIHLRNGRVIHLADANRWRVENEVLICQGNRNKEIARFPVDAVAGWYFDSENVTTYSPDDRRIELPDD